MKTKFNNLLNKVKSYFLQNPILLTIIVGLLIFIVIMIISNHSNNTYFRKEIRNERKIRKDLLKQKNSLEDSIFKYKAENQRLEVEVLTLYNTYKNQIEKDSIQLQYESNTINNLSGDELKRKLSEIRHPLRSEK